MWPFKKKAEETREPETFTLYASDDGLKRAEYAMKYAGFTINQTLYNQLPCIARIFDAYKELDTKAAKPKRKKKIN